ncbi:MAG: glucokinase [Trueperaceae bacterium]|nr:glucokinase [Trueperaceae bacterium]
MILACDVGGTKTDLALLQPGPDGMEVARRATYVSREHAALVDIVVDFVGERPPRLEAAGFGIAGPVVGDRARTTNLPWHVDGARLARAVGLPRVSLLNDVEAQAWAVPLLGEHDRVTLQAGDPAGDGPPGTVAVIAAGTGLGYAALLRGEGAARSLASEGGHADFSPVDELEAGLLRALRRDFGRVSVERVVSGPGVHRIYRYLREQEGVVADDAVDALLDPPDGHVGVDPSAAVARAALTGTSAVAERAVLRFLAAYGGEAGNWALRTLATGGVWLGGGVGHRLLLGPQGTPSGWRERAREAFVSRFLAKGRLAPWLATVPVHVVTTDLAPLLGAAHCARMERGR